MDLPLGATSPRSTSPASPRGQADAAAAACRRSRADVDALVAESRFRMSLTRDLLDDLAGPAPDLTTTASAPS